MNHIKDDMLLRTERLFLSRWTASDATLLRDLHGVAEATRHIGDGRPWTIATARSRMADWNHDLKRDGISKLKLSATEDGRFIGRAGFTYYPQGNFFELGYSIRREEWGRGYATETATALSAWLFENRSAQQFLAISDNDNPASIRVLEKIGMVETEIAGMRGPDQRLFCMQAPKAA